jgi:probable rRNA maturation factor
MITVTLTDVCKLYRFTQRQTSRIVTYVLQKEKRRNVDLSFIFIDDAIITSINKKYLKHNFTTDVITFSLNDRKMINAEIYINVVQAKRQAQEFGVTIKNEIMRLIIHGTLHALGYDDTTVELQKKMFRIQEQYVIGVASLV